MRSNWTWNKPDNVKQWRSGPAASRVRVRGDGQDCWSTGPVSAKSRKRPPAGQAGKGSKRIASRNFLRPGRLLSQSALERTGFLDGQENGGVAPAVQVGFVSGFDSGLDDVLDQVARLAQPLPGQLAVVDRQPVGQFRAVGRHPAGSGRGRFLLRSRACPWAWACPCRPAFLSRPVSPHSWPPWLISAAGAAAASAAGRTSSSADRSRPTSRRRGRYRPMPNLTAARFRASLTAALRRSPSSGCSLGAPRPPW